MFSFIRVDVVMMSLQSNRNSKTEFGTRDWGIGARPACLYFCLRSVDFGLEKQLNALNGT